MSFTNSFVPSEPDDLRWTLPTDAEASGEPDDNQPTKEDTLVDTDVDDLLDEGLDAPDEDPEEDLTSNDDGVETISEELAAEEPDRPARDHGESRRVGRFVEDPAALDGRGNDEFVDDEGVAGGDMTAEESAMHLDRE